jgi:hypothetical protein
MHRPTIIGLRDESAHRARLRQVGHCFSPSLMPDLERAVCGGAAALLQALSKRRGTPLDMHHWARAFALDVSSTRHHPLLFTLAPPAALTLLSAVARAKCISPPHAVAFSPRRR